MDDDSDENMSSEELLPPLASKETAKDVKISQYLDTEQTTIDRLKIEGGATRRRTNFHVVFLDEFVLRNKNIFGK